MISKSAEVIVMFIISIISSFSIKMIMPKLKDKSVEPIVEM